jgi:hypothetical protein
MVSHATLVKAQADAHPLASDAPDTPGRSYSWHGALAAVAKAVRSICLSGRATVGRAIAQTGVADARAYWPAHHHDPVFGMDSLGLRGRERCPGLQQHA